MTIVESLGGIGKEDLTVDDGEVHREHLQTVEQHERVVQTQQYYRWHWVDERRKRARGHAHALALALVRRRAT